LALLYNTEKNINFNDMPITLNDFKEGGALRQYVTKIGLLEQIDNNTLSEEELLARLDEAVTVIGVKDLDAESEDGDKKEKDAESEKTTYTINVHVLSTDGGTATADNIGTIEVNIGEGITVGLTATPEEGYNFVRWQISTDGENYTDSVTDVQIGVVVEKAGDYYYKAVFETSQGTTNNNDDNGVGEVDSQYGSNSGNGQ
jgi:hypothetical protein